ncbi:HTH_38 domain-containing protein [Trichonephila clavipes]|nr:HTH_38 domain-containing protein [Trichonephila clavipes]
MPLRRNRRQYEQLTDIPYNGLREAGWSNRRIGRHLLSDMVVARCWQQWITEGRVYRRGGSGRPRNTNDREDHAINQKSGHFGTNNVASIDSTPLSSFQTSSQENYKTEVGLRSRRPLLPLINVDWIFADLGQLGV